MRPQDAYPSIKKAKKKIPLVLALALLAQVSLLLFLKTNFFIHDKVSAAIIQLLKEEEFDFNIHDVQINFPTKISARNISAKSSDGVVYDLEKITLKINPIQLIFDRENAIHNFQCEKFNVMSQDRLISAHNVNIHNYNSKIIARSLIKTGSKSLNLCGVIDKENLLSLNITSSKGDSTKLRHFLKKAYDFKESLNLQAFASLSEKFYLHVAEGKGNPFATVNAELVISLNRNKPVISSSLSGKKLLVGNAQQKIKIDSFHFENHLLFKKDKWRRATGSTKLKGVILEGMTEGTLPDLDLQYLLTPASIEALFVNASDYIDSKIFLSTNPNRELIDGNIYLWPSLCDLQVNRGMQPTKLLHGKKVSIHISPSLESFDPATLCFKVMAKEFSFLESPPGDFAFNGILDDKLNIFIMKALGEFGRSKATGSFHQKWSPLAYKFDVEGRCFPEDLNAWMPSWWDNIWIDFEFPEETPYGKFIIEGIWKGPPGNSLTLGKVDAKDFKFRKLLITKSKISVKVDGNVTSIEGESIEHDDNFIQGNLKFPRQLSNSPYFLEFDFDGEYPLNLGRDVLGSTMKEKLKDINATSIDCRTKGKIFRQNPSNQQAEVTVEIRGAEEFKFHQVPVDNLNGNLNYKDSIFSGKFEGLSIADGYSNLIFELNQTEQSENLLLNVSLNEINTKKFFDITDHLINPESPLVSEIKTPDSDIDYDGNGSVFSLSLNAQGNPANFLQFEGTGNLQLKQKGLSQINILGGISSRLSEISPIPVASLNFNNLKAIFKLENEIILVSPLEITGSLSSITAEGNLNLASGDIDFISRLNVAGNIPIPGLKQIVKFADPFSKIAQFKISGPWRDPEWKVQINPQP
jgi:hypothetical protein